MLSQLDRIIEEVLYITSIQLRHNPLPIHRLPILHNLNKKMTVSIFAIVLQTFR